MSEVKLPDGWVTGNLSSAVEVKSGIGFPHKYQGNFFGEYPVYKVGDVSAAVIENKGILSKAGHYVSKVEAQELKGQVFRCGVTLFAKIGEAVKLNRRAFVSREGLADNNVMAVIPIHNGMDKFIYYFLQTLDLTDVSRSTTVPSIRKGDIEGISISYPSLAEQKIIADKLATLLVQVDSTKARLEKISKILKRFRQAVLAAAMSGKLTEEWRGTAISTDWKKGILKNFIKKPSYGTSAKSQKEGLIPVLRMGNLQNGKLDWSDLVYTSDKNEIEKYKLIAGDILFNRTNSPELVGKTSIYRGERDAIYAGYLIKVQCLDGLNPEYLNYHLNSHIAKQYCHEVKSDGVSQSNINAQKLAAYPLIVPSIEEQAEIVRRVEQLFSYADTIEKQVQNALERVNNLTHSILAKAFRGELTAQWRVENPDLISGENSAQALLVQIQQQRSSIKTIKRGKGNS